MRAQVIDAALSVARSFAPVPGYDRADLEQEALLTAWQAERSFDPVRGKLLVRVRVFVRQRMITIARDQARQKRTAVVFQIQDWDELARPDHPTWPLMDAVRSLPVTDQRYLIASACGFSNNEISDREDVSRRTVRRHLYRSRHDLREVA